MIVGKDVKPWVEKLKSVDWKSKADKVICKIKEYAIKAGRVAVRPLLQFYHQDSFPQWGHSISSSWAFGLKVLFACKSLYPKSSFFFKSHV